MPTLYSRRLEMSFRNCVRAKCKDNGCELKLHGFPADRVILDVDCIVPSGAAGERCDFVVAADDGGNTYFLPIEFKGGGIDCAKIQKQLKGGIDSFAAHLPKHYKCVPVLVSKRITRGEIRQLENARVACGGRGERKRIVHVFCNKALGWDKVRSESA